ncbi:MAG TPA: excinuclease ABC subunit UvrA [Verrucomicrobiae bacterium]|jgi:excinuclease ABC subunit A
MFARSFGSIRLRGGRQNNLKNINLDVPLRQLVVIAGLSGSGKSSLAFDTLFAEGQRRYIETFSPYARQFLDRMDKPQAESIEGIPPAIAIEQRNTVKSTRSTVGTMTEITDYAKAFWGRVSRLYCRQCGQSVQKDPPASIWQAIRGEAREGEAMIAFDLALSEKFSLEESLALIARQGYRRLLLEGEVVPLEEFAARIKSLRPARITVVQDRVKLASANRGRFTQACEQAYHFGKGKLAVRIASQARLFSSGLHCAQCDLEYREATPALFSFNHPIGACPACRGFGRIIAINYKAAVPDWSKTLAEGAVKPWQTPSNAECQADMMKFARKRGAPTDVPFGKLPQKWRDWVIDGDEGYGTDAAHKWPRAWYGVKGYFRWLESRAYKMHVRVQLARYRIYKPCPECHGARLRPEALLYRAGGLTLPDFFRLTVEGALQFIKSLAAHKLPKSDPAGLALEEVQSRLAYLDAAGLGYLTLDRPTRSLSGGETERVNLTACLGSRLVNTLFVLDEPSVGLHARDTGRLVHLIRQLRDAGNTVVVVEHEASVMRAADQIIELGPGHGESGGEVVFQGTFADILRAPASLTGAYLAGTKQIEAPPRRPVTASEPPRLTLRHVRLHNLRDLTVEIPLGRLVCVTGVSGSGKSTLVTQVLTPALQAKLRGNSNPEAVPSEEDDAGETETEEAAAAPIALEGWESLSQVVAVDQSPLGRTPRSNPGVYIGAFDDIRAFFAQDEEARRRGLSDSAFSFNSIQGQCERCRGAGFEKIEMQFLSDVFVRCPDCNGRRYRAHILEVKVTGATKSGVKRAWSIANVLEATVDEAVDFFGGFPDSRPATRAAASLRLLQETGLGYLHVGQPLNTLSGGECQRLKLVQHLAEAGASIASETARVLFIFDEPTTGLHFEDVRLLLKVLQRLVDQGHTVVVIEHNLDVNRAADWLIDLGPEGGAEGGLLVAEGTPEQVASITKSHTGRALAGMN